MKSMFDKVDFQEIKIERIEKIRSVTKTEDGVFDISFNYIAHLEDGRCIEVDKNSCDNVGKDVLVVNINNGEEVTWIASNEEKKTKLEKTFIQETIFTLIINLIPLYLLISLGFITQQIKNNFIETIGYTLVSLFLCFTVYLRVHNDILIKAKAIFKIRSFKKKYRSIKEP